MSPTRPPTHALLHSSLCKAQTPCPSASLFSADHPSTLSASRRGVHEPGGDVPSPPINAMQGTATQKCSESATLPPSTATSPCPILAHARHPRHQLHAKPLRLVADEQRRRGTATAHCTVPACTPRSLSRCRPPFHTPWPPL